MSGGGNIEGSSDKRYDCFVSFPGSQNLSNLGFIGPGLNYTVRDLSSEVDERLRRFPRHLSAFYDHKEIKGHWPDYMSNSIHQLRGGGVALVLLTAEYLRRRYCLAELRAFLNLERLRDVAGRESEAVHIFVVNLKIDEQAGRNVLRNGALNEFIGADLGKILLAASGQDTQHPPRGCE